MKQIDWPVALMVVGGVGFVALSAMRPQANSFEIVRDSDIVNGTGAVVIEPYNRLRKPVPQQAQQPRDLYPHLPKPPEVKPQRQPSRMVSIAQLFEGGSDSIVAIAIGAAEGTRRPNGAKNRAYWGHRDPGNGVWNVGSFSCQPSTCSNREPDGADRQQLAKLKRQSQRFVNLSKQHNVPLNLEEFINALDGHNQAPKIVADYQGSYFERLQEAKAKGKIGMEAIVYARAMAFHVNGRWDARGLGNNGRRIWRDQLRRAEEIREALRQAGYN